MQSTPHVAAVVILAGTLASAAESNAPAPAPAAPRAQVQSGNEPSPAYPYGRPHPDAPPELSQFAFFVGEFDCVDSIRQQDGSTITFPAIWNAKYFLNGFGIQDQYWTPRFFTSNIRIFDPQSKSWKVTFFRMPGYQNSQWEGKQVGDEIHIRAAGQSTGPALTFHNIRDDGFDWHSGGATPGWTSSCKRRR